MRRREFVTLVGGAVAWPIVARAQQSGSQVWRVAVLTGYVEDDAEAKRRVTTFQKALEAQGWSVGSNVQIDYRFAAGNYDRIRSQAIEAIELKPDVILASGSPILLAVQNIAPSIPVVFVQIDDPLASGVVQSLAHPGGNYTGFSPFEFSMGSKMLGVLKDVAPQVANVAVVLNPDSKPHAGIWRNIEAAAPGIGVRVTASYVRNLPEIERAIAAQAKQPNAGLLFLSYTLTNIHRREISDLAARHRLPAIYAFRHMVAAGGLVSYGIDPVEQFGDAAGYVDRILRGEKAGDLPVQGPTKFQMVINLKTAKALGLTIPDSLQLRADEVIE
jgi:putative tryptophan/tyrosine transport system substrate-binding protein